MVYPFEGITMEPKKSIFWSKPPPLRHEFGSFPIADVSVCLSTESQKPELTRVFTCKVLRIVVATESGS